MLKTITNLLFPEKVKVLKYATKEDARDRSIREYRERYNNAYLKNDRTTEMYWSILELKSGEWVCMCDGDFRPTYAEDDQMGENPIYPSNYVEIKKSDIKQNEEGI